MIRRSVFIAVLLTLVAAALSPASGSRFELQPTASKKTLRIMTYNIHVGVGMDKKLDLQRIADVINRENPDLLVSRKLIAA